MIVNSLRWQRMLTLGVVFAAAPAVQAQPSAPHLAYVYPAGGRQGETFEVKVGGQYLTGVTGVYLSGPDVQATAVNLAKPMTQKEINALRERLQELLKRAKEKDPTVLAEIAKIRKKLALVNRNINPALAETVTLRIKIAPDAALGARELRLATPLGLSNPLVFRIDQLPEFCEKDPNSGEVPPETTITLPAIVNGRIIPGDGDLSRFPPRAAEQFVPGDVDRYHFQARRGQQLVVVARARELIPYLADAVPGWFQAVVTLYDAAGRELAYDDDYRFHPDPVLHYEIPADGEYAFEIRDALYRGREDFVYRIAIGELPFVTSIFPLGGPAGTRTEVALEGWNLPVNRVTTGPGRRDRGAPPPPRGRQARDTAVAGVGGLTIRPVCVSKGDLVSNPVPFAVDTLPECLETETNDLPRNAQAVTLPIIVNGWIDKGGDRDVFRFEGRAGDRIVAEVCARRLDSPVDSVLKLTDAAGRQLAFNDDHDNKGGGLETHHADSFVLTTLPATGTYYVHLGDAQRRGGPEYGYRLRISPPRPDFALRISPSALNAGAGQTVPVSVYALRQDGFSGPITLALQDAPRGFILSGGVVPEGQDHVLVTLTLPTAPQNQPLSLRAEGRAMVDGQEITRQVVPADDMEQAFAYHHLVPARELYVTPLKRGMTRTFVKVLSELPVRIPVGGAARVRVAIPTNRAFSRIQFELSDPPEGISIRETFSDPKGTDIVLACDAARVRPGHKGNLIVAAFGERPPAPGKAKANRPRSTLGTLPAVPFEVVPPARD